MELSVKAKGLNQGELRKIVKTNTLFDKSHIEVTPFITNMFLLIYMLYTVGLSYLTILNVDLRMT